MKKRALFTSTLD